MDNSFSTPKLEPVILSVSLGMVVIDEIHQHSRAPIIDIAGGSGTYATLGSRLAVEPSQATQVGCLVLAGKDFPNAIRAEIQSWNLQLVLQVDPEKLSTRGLLEYEDDTFGPKKFRYTTTPLKAQPADLVNTPLLGAKAIHFLATPEEIQRQVPELLSLRLQHGFKDCPFIIWEPFPAYCTPQHRQSFIEACKFVDVFSPNHHEMVALFEDKPSLDFSPLVLEQYALTFLPAVRPSTMAAIVIRAGKQGCLVVSSPVERVWLPAFYDDGSPKVVDPTGAGNAFLGGYMIGFHLTQDVVIASQYGSVTASFALEQIGLPIREDVKDQEYWNGVRVVDRLEQYKARLENAAELQHKEQGAFVKSAA